ncbi:histidine phosphatase family protein [Bacillus testis]|uniref:histidine phosphatase family protein n=1 Tax=Bacillus testis TaxID=1622072 RepID=UPI00067F4CC0|nr:histidine phosphatase family protein [Bacillus testis]
MTKIALIRHGNTAWNTEKRAQGSSNIPLDEAGMAQGKKLAERLSEESWDVLYSSDLLRAKQTAELIAAKLPPLEIHYDSRLREASGGLIEGTIESERISKWGPDWRTMDLGMEPADQVAARGIAAMDDIVKAHQGQNILVVTHGAFIKHLLKRLIPHMDMNVPMLNTSISMIHLDDGKWDCSLFNCAAHLDTE